MSPRALTAVGALALLVVLAGCSAPGTLDLTHVDESDVADEATEPVVHDETEPPAEDENVTLAAIANGTTTVTDVSPPVSTERVRRHDGRYYNLSARVVGTQPGVRIAVGVDTNGTVEDGRVVAFDQLSHRDRETIRPILETDDPPSEEPGVDATLVGVYTAGERDASAFVGEDAVDGVTYEGRTYPVRVRDVDDTTLRTYEYTATEIAADADAYGEQLIDRYAFSFESLSDAERDILDDARNGTYVASDTGDDAFDSLVDRFRSHDAVYLTPGERGSWVVRYDGLLWWAEMRYEGFVDVEPTTDETPPATPPPA